MVMPDRIPSSAALFAMSLGTAGMSYAMQMAEMEREAISAIQRVPPEMRARILAPYCRTRGEVATGSRCHCERDE